MLSPHWMPDGQSIVLSGLSESGVSDLYRVRLPGGELEPLTSDRYQDLDPSPSADGRRLVFASDRTAGGLEGAANLFVLDLATGQSSQLTSGTGWMSRPLWAPDGRIYFTSDRDGVLNVFSVDHAGHRAEGDLVLDAAHSTRVPLPEGGLLAGGFHDLSWNLYRVPGGHGGPTRTASSTSRGPPRRSGPGTQPGDTAASFAARREPYRRKLDVDFAAGERGRRPGLRRRAGHLLRR